jgi:hypothetical protein
MADAGCLRLGREGVGRHRLRKMSRSVTILSLSWWLRLRVCWRVVAARDRVFPLVVVDTDGSETERVFAGRRVGLWFGLWCLLTDAIWPFGDCPGEKIVRRLQVCEQVVVVMLLLRGGSALKTTYLCLGSKSTPFVDLLERTEAVSEPLRELLLRWLAISRAQ